MRSKSSEFSVDIESVAGFSPISVNYSCVSAFSPLGKSLSRPKPVLSSNSHSRNTVKAAISVWKSRITHEKPTLSKDFELSDDQIRRFVANNRAKSGFSPSQHDQNVSFSLLSPRFDQSGSGLNPSETIKLLIQQLDRTEEGGNAQLKLFRESLRQFTLSARGQRSGASSVRQGFAEFEEIDVDLFDFMENEVELPERVSRDMNLEQVTSEALLARVQKLEASICGMYYSRVVLAVVTRTGNEGRAHCSERNTPAENHFPPLFVLLTQDKRDREAEEQSWVVLLVVAEGTLYI